MRKIFLDTNVIVDFLGERHPFYNSIARVLTLADQKKILVYTSPIAISTVFYLLSKYENSKEALEKIRKFKILCSISMVNDEVVDKAIVSNFKDFEDALQYYSAVSTECEVIITRNEKDFKNALIPVMDAESFLQTIKKI